MNNKDFADIVISSRIRLARNFDLIPFPAKLNDERGYEVLNNVYQAVKDADDFKVYTIDSLSKQTKGVLFEKHLISAVLTGQDRFGAVILNNDESISIMVNEEDHIREQCILKGLNLGEAWQKISKIDNLILSKNNIAYSPKLGFLTACVTNLGTGLRASVMMFLPGLSMLNKIDELSRVVRSLGQTIRGSYGEGSEGEAYMYQVSNEITLGKTEEQIIEEVNKTILKICALERDARKSLYEANKLAINDMCMRAYGVLSNSFVMPKNEFMNLIGKVKLGQSLGIINLKDNGVIDDLMHVCQDFSLRELSGKKFNGNEGDVFRAEYLRKILKNS